jgi:flagellar hook-basal body complex protein FliE
MAIAPITELMPPVSLGPIHGPEASSAAGGAVGATDTPAVSFADVFGKAVDQANRADAFASQKVEALARGFGDDLHGTMIAVKEADISIKLVGTIRNKLLDAFNEIWRTSV